MVFPVMSAAEGPKADLTELKNKIAEIEAISENEYLYTETSWKKMMSAVREAKLFTENNAQQDVDLMTNNLTALKNALVLDNTERKRGDLSGDGVFDMTDAVMSLQINAGIFTPSAKQLKAGDLNENGIIDLNDCVRMLQAVAKILPDL